jgi:hypothetical protein
MKREEQQQPSSALERQSTVAEKGGQQLGVAPKREEGILKVKDIFDKASTHSKHARERRRGAEERRREWGHVQRLLRWLHFPYVSSLPCVLCRS